MKFHQEIQQVPPQPEDLKPEYLTFKHIALENQRREREWRRRQWREQFPEQFMDHVSPVQEKINWATEGF